MRNITNNSHNKERFSQIKGKALDEARSVAPQYCEKCGNKYSDKSFNLVQKHENQSVFHLKCEKCGNNYILNVVSAAPNMMASQRSSLNIDLTDSNEMAKFAGKSAVSRNEALDIKILLNKKSIEAELS